LRRERRRTESQICGIDEQLDVMVISGMKISLLYLVEIRQGFD
jgi:hypothetical protein